MDTGLRRYDECFNCSLLDKSLVHDLFFLKLRSFVISAWFHPRKHSFAWGGMDLKPRTTCAK